MEKLVKSRLKVNIRKDIEEIVAKIVKMNVNKVAKAKARNASYEVIKEKVRKDIKKGLAEYAVQRSKEAFDSITKAKIEEMKKKIEEL